MPDKAIRLFLSLIAQPLFLENSKQTNTTESYFNEKRYKSSLTFFPLFTAS